MQFKNLIISLFFLFPSFLFSQNFFKNINANPVVIERNEPFQIMAEPLETGMDSMRIYFVREKDGLFWEILGGKEVEYNIVLKDDGSFENDIANDNIYVSDWITNTTWSSYTGAIDEELFIWKNDLNIYRSGITETIADYGFYLYLRAIKTSDAPPSETNLTVYNDRIQYSDYVINYVVDEPLRPHYIGDEINNLFGNVFCADNHEIVSTHAFPVPNAGFSGRHINLNNQTEGVCMHNLDNPNKASEANTIMVNSLNHGLWAHEYLHRWASHCHELEIVSNSSHWNIMDFPESGFGAAFFNFIPLEGDTFSAREVYAVRYNKLELYLMGLISIDEIDWPIRYLRNGKTIRIDDSDEREGFRKLVTGEMTNLTKEKFLSVAGPRNPERLHYSTLKTSLVVHSTRFLTQKEMAFYDYFMKRWEEEGDIRNRTIFYATGNRLRHQTALRKVNYRIEEQHTICEGESYEGYTQSGYYSSNINNQCDSVRVVNLTVLPKKEATQTIQVCAGESYEGYSVSGIYEDTFTGTSGCDSLRRLELTVLPKKETTQTIQVCAGESYEGYILNGIYEDTFISTSGCDSLRRLELTVLPSATSMLNVQICEGETFENYSVPGTYEDVYKQANGCDSTRIVNLRVLPKTHFMCEATNGLTNESANRLEIFPNPTVGNLTINTNLNLRNQDIQVLDLNGKVLLNIPLLQHNQINIQHLAKGVYFIKCIHPELTFVKRIIKL